MNNRLITLFSIVALMVSLGSFSYAYFNKTKVGFVRSADLFQGYVGMKEAKARYDEKVTVWQSNYDTLLKDYQASVNNFNLTYNKLNAKEKEERKQLLKSQISNLEQYKATLQEKIEKEDNALTDGVYNQVNTYIKEYGEKNGYTVILGTMTGGNILFAKDYIDVTDEVMKGLNEKFKGETIKK